MKKMIMALTLAMSMAVAGVCSAAGDGTILNKEQKAAEAMTTALTTDEGTLAQAAVGFNAELKEKLKQEQFDGMKKAVKEKFGALKETRFIEFVRYNDGDRVTYVGNFVKEPQVQVTYLFDATGKIFNFILTPIKPPAAQPAQQPAPAKK